MNNNNKKRQPSLFMIILAIFLIFVYVDKDAVTNFYNTIYTSLIPFFYSIVIVYLLNPIIKFCMRNLEKYVPIIKEHTRKIISVVIAYIIFGLFIYFLVINIVPILRDNILEFADHFPEMVNKILLNIEKVAEYFRITKMSEVENTIYSYIEEYLSVDTISALLKSSLPYIYNTSSYILNWLYNIGIAFIISMYLVFETDSVIYYCKKIFRAIFGQRRYNITKLIVKDSYDMFNVYIISKIKDSMIVGILLFILMKIFGLKYSVLLSICVAITNMIPYIGPFIGGILGVVLLLSVSLEQSLIFFVIILVLQQLDCWLIGVIVVEKDTKMSPLLILMSVIVAGALWGWVGMLIGTPIAQIIQYVVNLMVQAEEMKNDYKEADL